MKWFDKRIESRLCKSLRRFFVIHENNYGLNLIGHHPHLDDSSPISSQDHVQKALHCNSHIVPNVGRKHDVGNGAINRFMKVKLIMKDAVLVELKVKRIQIKSVMPH
ncbi:unnamed protein product [Heterobilharzia americana]|nr:unnamed protein product [Heterobilharzia americana]